MYEKLQILFNLYDAFLPGIFKKGLFTILAKDNIDKNATSTLAKSHYHGTSISILQFPTSSNNGADLPSTESPEILSSSNKLAPLPKQYSYVKPIPYKPGQGDLFAPVCTVNFDNENDMANLERSIDEEIVWLDNSFPLSINPLPSTKSWAQHHAAYKRNDDCMPGINAGMPLIREPVHILNVQYHCMQINSRCIRSTSVYINKGDTMVISHRIPKLFFNDGCLTYRENVFSMPWTIHPW